MKSSYFPSEKVVEKQRNTWIYAISEDYFDSSLNTWKHLGIKIGYSKNPFTRKSNLNVGTTTKLTLIKTLQCFNGKQTEEIIHHMWQSKKIRGEWFDVTREEVDRAFHTAQFFEKCKYGTLTNGMN
jgi:hypothetical protein